MLNEKLKEFYDLFEHFVSGEWIYETKKLSVNSTPHIMAVKAHSDDMRLTRVDAADGCVSAKMGNFLFFWTAYFCRSCTRKTQLA